MKTDKNKPKSMLEIDKDIVLSTNAGRSYGNRKLKEYTCDDFASYVLDNEELNGSGRISEDSYLSEIEYLQYIPNAFARVYLYGVWVLLKMFLD